LFRRYIFTNVIIEKEYNIFIIDTEYNSQVKNIIEIGILSTSDNASNHTLIKPVNREGNFNPVAWQQQKVHNISDSDIKDAPLWKDVIERVSNLFYNAITNILIAHNYTSDIKVVANANAIHVTSFPENCV